MSAFTTLLRGLVLTAATMTTLATGVTTAGATYPGTTNGRLAFGVGVDGNTDVYSVMPNGRAARRLTDDPAFEACPAYSPDGRFLAWCGPGGVWVMKQNGTDKRQLTSFGAFPDFSPDGSKVVFMSGPPSPDIYVVNLDGSGLTQLTGDPSFDGFPAWSPDGRTVVFESNRSGILQLWLMHADGSDQRQLTFDPIPKDQVPDWSPDGSTIAYVARTAPVGGDIWLINADGSDPRPLSSGADDLGPAWSPDGTQIAFLDWGSRTVYVMNADGSDRYPVHPGGTQFVPAWQPRGNRLTSGPWDLASQLSG